MPVIYSQNPDTVATPIRSLLERIATCPIHIAPERESDFGSILAEFRWKYEVPVDDGKAGISADPDDAIVKTPLAQLEWLWAFTYGFLAGFDAARKLGPGVEITVADCPELEKPFALLSWAHDGLKRGVRSEWPEDLPRPDRPELWDAERIEKTNRFFLGSLAFIFLHEIGHIVLKHPSPKFQADAESIACEWEADRWAAKWIFEKCPDDERMRIFRGNCCTLALSLINLLEARNAPQRGKITHPPTVERILDFVSRHFPESDGPKSAISDFPLYLASVILHVQRVNLGLDVAIDQTHDSVTDYLIDALRSFQQRA